MPLTVLVGTVKDRAGIQVSTYDSEIDRLIVRLLPVLTYAIQDGALQSFEPGLVATLNEGAAEICAGEFLAQYYRRPELLLSVIIGDLQLFPRRFDQPRDPSGLIASGWARLRPWLKRDQAVPIGAMISQADGKQGVDEE